MTTFDLPAALDRAVDVIHEGGWIKNEYGDIGNAAEPHCTMGAVRTALYEQVMADHTNQEKLGVFHAMSLIENRYLAPLTGSGRFSVPQWNDLVAESADDVVHLLKRGAENARSGILPAN